MPHDVAPHGAWTSHLDPERLYAQPPSPDWPCRGRDGALYWIEERPAEGGRQVLVGLGADGARVEVTPAGYDLRTRVHEYGGRCHVVNGDWVYFNHRGDGRIHRQRLDGSDAPRPLVPSPEPTGASGALPGYTGFADLTVTPDGRWLVAVAERLREGGEPLAAIVAVATEALDEPLPPRVLVEGRDFLAAPAISPCGRRLAWLEWDHPWMPWDESRICVADLAPGSGCPEPGRSRVVAGGSARSVCPPGFLADGTLLFAMDGPGEGADGWWNLHAWDEAGLRRITRDVGVEYGTAHWIFGERRWVETGPGRLLAARARGAGDELVRVAVPDGTVERIDHGGEVATFDALWGRAHGRGALFAMTTASRGTRIAGVEPGGGIAIQVKAGSQAPEVLAEADISVARTLSYPTRDGHAAWANYYPPRNARFEAPPGEKPPLLVLIHGGPSARATAALDLRRQFWTHRGFAVLDVNHRGSTGYGRACRQHLYGRWGLVDVDDAIDGIDHVVAAGLADRERVFIRGGSAGGYAVLCALTRYPDRFRGGACYYGIGNLAALARTTQKFESRYADRLVGEPWDERRAAQPDSPWYARSPVHHIDRLRTPMILFHGSEDRVVPPELSREMARGLAARGIEHEHVEYPGEGHGFRLARNRIDALTRELAFYRRLLGLAGTEETRA